MIISSIGFIGVFTLIVLVHELGHFLAAKKTGVKVYEFSIGFPFSPKILTLFRHNETEFTVRLIPLGGFVSFSKGESDESIELFKTSLLNRAFILSAGSIFNILFAFLAFLLFFAIVKQLSLTGAIHSSINLTLDILKGTISFILDLFSGNGSAEGLIGPVGIAVLAGKAAMKGIEYLLYFRGLLSISLGIINLLPLPSLDGGHLFMLLIESTRRKPISLKLYQLISVIGMLLFVILSVFITYKDITKLFV